MRTIPENLYFFDPVSVRLIQMGFCRYFSFAFCGKLFYRMYFGLASFIDDSMAKPDIRR
jgi:hypothetical protein